MDRGLQVTRVADDGRNLAHLWTSDSLIRISKLRMIEEVERFDPELNKQPLVNGEGFEERRVKVRAARTKEGVTPRIAVGIRRRVGIRVREKPGSDGLRVDDLHTRNNVGTA